MPDGFNSQSNGNDGQFDPMVYRQLKTAQTLITISIFAGPISLIIGGVLLSSAALVCAIIGYVKLRRIKRNSHAPMDVVRSLNTQAILALVVSIVAFGLNLYSFIVLFSALYSAIESGDVNQVMDMFNGGNNAFTQDPSNGSVESGSIWDR